MKRFILVVFLILALTNQAYAMGMFGGGGGGGSSSVAGSGGGGGKSNTASGSNPSTNMASNSSPSGQTGSGGSTTMAANSVQTLGGPSEPAATPELTTIFLLGSGLLGLLGLKRKFKK